MSNHPQHTDLPFFSSGTPKPVGFSPQKVLPSTPKPKNMNEKFCYTENQEAHWVICRAAGIPFVMIESKGGEFNLIRFDLVPTMPGHGPELEYMDLLEPLYEQYCQQNQIAADMKECGGEGRNGFFKVHAQETENLATRLYDLLVTMTNRDNARYAEKLLAGKKELYLS